jgi:hypothetical protein
MTQKPPRLMGRLIREGDAGPYCPICHSSFSLKWIFFKTDRCINKYCKNRDLKQVFAAHVKLLTHDEIEKMLDEALK